jgi:hypothetical protein
MTTYIKDDNENKRELNFSKELELDYKDLDPQKGNFSPRILYNTENNFDFMESTNTSFQISINNIVESYIDLVNKIYFSSFLNPLQELESKDKFKMTSLDFLMNPLRQSMPFEMWSPYEVALFQCCICKFGKDFELFTKIIKSKNVDEIIDFYYQWEATKYYNAWSLNQMKKIKYLINK